MRCVFLVFIFLFCDAYKVLVFNPAFGASHSNFLGKISDILLDAGNNVTMLIPTYVESKSHLVGSKKVKNILRIGQDPRAQEILGYSETEERMRKRVWDTVQDTSQLFPILKNMSRASSLQCEYIMRQSEILEVLREQKFDLAISESVYTCGLALFDKIGIQTVITADSMGFQDLTKYALGEPSSTSYYPGLFSADNDDLSFLGRAKSLTTYLFSLGFSKYRANEELSALNTSKTWFDYLDNIAFSMLNSNQYLDYPCPVLPKTVFVGGIQVIEGGQLDKKWDDILNLRNNTILISFGSHSYSSDMPDSYKNAFLEVFKSFPDITFIWKYEIENATIVDHLPNVILTTWMPQTDLLADKRLTLFITHGGLGSVMELAYSGVPAVVVPLFGDQYRNAHMLTRHGGAIQLDKSKLGEDGEIEKVIRRVIDDPSYTQNATKLARILKNQPNTPRDVVLKHCDFAVQFGSLESIKSKGRLLNFVQFNNLDIIALAVASILVIILIIFLILRFIHIQITKLWRFMNQAGILGESPPSKSAKEKEHMLEK